MDKIFNDLKFDEKGLIPAIAQDYRSGEVLMLAYMNREALEKTLETGKMHYWSRSRNKLWLKGETSGHFQNMKSVCLDCDGDTLLFRVEQIGAACHTDNYTCFYRRLSEDGVFGEASNGINKSPADMSYILREVYNIIVDRKIHPKEGSYTNYLFEKGLDKILKKVGEECAEVIIAAKNKSRDEVRYEAADLLYHLLVLLVERDMDPNEVYEELISRR